MSLIYIKKNVKDLGMMNEQLILAYIFFVRPSYYYKTVWDLIIRNFFGDILQSKDTMAA